MGDGIEQTDGFGEAYWAQAHDERRMRRVVRIQVEQTRREWGGVSIAAERDASACALYADAAVALLACAYPGAAIVLDIDGDAVAGHDRITLTYSDGTTSVNDLWSGDRTDIATVLCAAWERTLTALATAEDPR